MTAAQSGATLGSLVSARRIETKESQQQAAVAMGTTDVTLGKWERDADYPKKMEWIDKLSAWLELDHFTVYRAIRATKDQLGDPDYGDAQAMRPYLSRVA